MANELEAAEVIATFRRTYAVSNLGLIVAQHPRREDIVTGIIGLDRGSVVQLGMQDLPGQPGVAVYYEGLDVWESIEGVDGDPEFTLHFARTWFVMALSTIGQIASDSGYWDKTPELELLRHLRNGVSHGNRFNFRTGEPRRPAHFGHHRLTAQNHGDEVLFDFMGAGDIMALFDHVEAHLRSRI
jgi:hypothetical protein